MIVSSGDASDSAAPLLEFLTSVFEDDLDLGTPYTNAPSFSDADLKIINDTAVRPVSLPPPPSGRAFVSPVPEPVASDMEVVFALALLLRYRSTPLPARYAAELEWMCAGRFHESRLCVDHA